ncbi:MAG: helix-turn-helix transcriptional regulator, partial [Clostridiales bacterium]|nr:helix-turn-helix transcriptional regulator [Clostridiales bacterium]
MDFGSKLQSLRKISNLSQEELADKLGVSRQAVSKWESNTAYPEMDKLVVMSKLFKCSMDDLVNDETTSQSIIERKNSKVQNYFDSFLEFITKTINMFTSMKFNNVLKCVIEMGIVSIIMY